jgi:cytochrome c553
MIEQKKGAELKQDWKNIKMISLLSIHLIATEFKNSLQIDLTTPPSQDKSTKSWEYSYFHMVPTVAAVTMLSKFQNDVKTSENRVVAFCHEQVGKVTVRFDTYAAIVGQSSNYLDAWSGNRDHGRCGCIQ